MHPLPEKLKKLEYNVRIGKIDLALSPQVGEAQLVTALPTLMLYEKGKRVKVLTGLHTKKGILLDFGLKVRT